MNRKGKNEEEAEEELETGEQESEDQSLHSNFSSL